MKTKSLFSLVLNEFLIDKLLIHFFRLKEVLLVTLLTLGALVTLVILVTTKDHAIQAGSCCPTEPKLEPNHLGVLQVLQQERKAETEMEMEVVDDPLTNPDLVTQVRINTMGIKALSREITKLDIMAYCDPASNSGSTPQRFRDKNDKSCNWKRNKTFRHFL